MHTAKRHVIFTAWSCEINVNIPSKDSEIVRDVNETDKLTCTISISLCINEIYV